MDIEAGQQMAQCYILLCITSEWHEEDSKKLLGSRGGMTTVHWPEYAKPERGLQALPMLHRHPVSALNQKEADTFSLLNVHIVQAIIIRLRCLIQSPAVGFYSLSG